jgi:hypothetical protein
MAKLTKAQQKRLVNEILNKSKKLYMVKRKDYQNIVPSKDMDAIERLCNKWLKRIG